MTEEQVFLAALDLPDAAARAAYLDEACAGDAEQRRQVEELLAVHFRSGEFLDAPMVNRRENETRDANTVSVRGDAEGGTEEPDDLHFLQPPTRPDSLGRIGHYEVLQVLGKGGFGIVFRAFDDVLQRVVAVKVLAPGMAATSPARKRFLREARSSAAIRHENVVQVHQVEEQPLPYLVMEFIPGETLQQRLDRTGPLDLPEILRVGRQVAEGLAAAHAQGLIHRDVKPANVLIESGLHGRAKLTDFGLARAADDASISQSGVVAGTPMYMAPEQARGESLDPRSDLFSLGSLLYVMCTGRPPFRAAGTMAVLKRVCEDTPRPIREVIPEVPEWLCRVVQKLHAKDPAARYQSAREVADVLADCERQVKEFGGLRDYSRIPGGRPARPRRWRWVAAALVAVLAVWGLHAWFSQRPTERPDGAAAEDRARFQGRWRMVALERHGKQLPVDPLVFGYRAEFFGDMSVTYVDGKPWYAKFALNAGTEPKRMEARPQGLAPIRHLYQFVGDRLVVAQGVQGEAPPTGFTTTPETWFSVATYERDTGPPADGFVSLFNGEDLTGWKMHPFCAGKWRVEDGILTGRGDTTYLFSESGNYADFHLRVEAMINAAGDSGVFFRVPFEVRIPEESKEPHLTGGYEANIGVRANYAVHTGSVMTYGEPSVRGPLRLHRPDEWFLLEVIARGNHIQTRVNGTVTAEYRDEKRQFTRGHLALQTWGLGMTLVGFRKIEVKELSTPASDKGRLQGRWRMVAAERLGKAIAVADLKDVDWIEFAGDQQTTFWDGKQWPGAFTLNAEADPRELDFVSAKYAPVRCLYRFEGDNLVLALGLPGKARPTAFRTTPETTFMVATYARDTGPAAAPDVVGEDVDGKKFQLRDHRGKVVLVDFWANWCGYCRQLYPYRRDLAKRFAGRPFSLIGVNYDDSSATARRAMTRELIPWPSLWDGQGVVTPEGFGPGPIAKAFKVTAIPTLVLVDKRGTVRHTVAGMPKNLPGLDKKIAELLAEPSVPVEAKAK